MKRSDLIKECDRLFSILVRLEETNENGIGKCYICYKKLHYRDMENMHYHPRRNMNTRYYRDNCHGGCFTCNVELQGNMKAYSEALESNDVNLIELQFLARSIEKIMTFELEEIRNKLNILCKEFLKDKNFTVTI